MMGFQMDNRRYSLNFAGHIGLMFFLIFICSAQRTDVNEPPNTEQTLNDIFLPSSSLGRRVFSRYTDIEKTLSIITQEALNKEASLQVRSEALLTIGRLQDYFGNRLLLEVIEDSQELPEVRSVALVALFSNKKPENGFFAWEDHPMVLVGKEQIPVTDVNESHNRVLIDIIQDSNSPIILKSVSAQIASIIVAESSTGMLFGMIADAYLDSDVKKDKSIILAALNSHSSDEATGFLLSLADKETDPYFRFKIFLAIPAFAKANVDWLKAYYEEDSTINKLLIMEKIASSFTLTVADDSGSPRRKYANIDAKYLNEYFNLVSQEIDNYRNIPLLLNICQRLHTLPEESVAMAEATRASLLIVDAEDGSEAAIAIQSSLQNLNRLLGK